MNDKFFLILLLLFSACSGQSFRNNTAGLGFLSEKPDAHNIRFRMHEVEFKAVSCPSKGAYLIRNYKSGEKGYIDYATVASAYESNEKYVVFNFEPSGFNFAPYHQRIFVRKGSDQCSIKVAANMMALMDGPMFDDSCASNNSENCKKLKQASLKGIQVFVDILNEATGQDFLNTNAESSFLYSPSKDQWLLNIYHKNSGNVEKLIPYSPVRFDKGSR